MPTADGHVATPRADRYLSQLVEHLSHLRHSPREGPRSAERSHHPHDQHSQDTKGAGPPLVRHVEHSETSAHIEFDWGVLTLTATSTGLTIHVDAHDPHAVARGQHLIAQRIETIGRRDELLVTWLPPRPS